MAAGSGMGRASQAVFATCAFAALIACGGETEAAGRTGFGGANYSGTETNQVQANRAGMTPPSRLPIERGLYVSEYQDGGCAGTTELFIYDGENIGEVSTNIRNTPRGHFSSVERIVHVGPPRGIRLTPEFAAASRGFTQVWTTDWEAENVPSDAESSPALALRATGPERFTKLTSTGGMGSNPTVEYHEETYQKCAFARLSPGMQAAVRDQLPQLADASSAGATPTSTSASISSPPVPQGYYARDRDCRVVLAEAARGEPEDLYLFNQRGLRDFMGGTVVISGFEPLGGQRHRVRARMFDENDNPTNADFTIAVTGANSFTIEARADTPAERYTRCPDSQVPRAVREGYEF